MRRLLPAAIAALVLLPPAPAAAAASAAAPPRWRSGIAAADDYARSRAGNVAFAVRTGRGVAGRSPDVDFPSASVVKAMLMVAYLRQPSVRARALRSGERDLLTPMIRWSSN